MPATKRGSGAAPSARAKLTKSDAPVHFVLAHAAGHHPAGSKHSTMQRWSTALRKHGTVHDDLVYPKPFNLMPRLVAAHAKAIDSIPKGAKVVLVGVGMGARVAVHLMGGTPGDDGKQLAALPASTRERVALMVAIDYPLLRVGTREVRSAPLKALPQATPPTLFVHGPGDKHADAVKLKAIIKQMKSHAELVEVQSGSEKPTDDDLSVVVKRIAAAI